MAVFGDLDEGIGAEHAAELGVVEAAVHVDDAAVIEHFVAGVAAIIFLRRAAEGIAIGLAEGHGGGGGRAFSPRIVGLVFGALVGEGVVLPFAGDEGIGGAEVVIELGGEADGFACVRRDGAGVNHVAEAVAVHAFVLGDGNAGVSGAAMDFALVAAEVEGALGFVGAGAGAGFPLAGAVACGIKEELALDVGGGLELGACEIVQGGGCGVGEVAQLAEG